MDQSQVKQIYVHSKDLGFFTQHPFTVQRFERDGDGNLELVWCNHAGAIEEVYDADFEGMGFTRTVLICDKCDAYKREDDNYWEDAPYEGYHGNIR